MGVFRIFPLGIRVGLKWVTPEEYLKRKHAKCQELEKFREVYIPKNCKVCGASFDIETFPKTKTGNFSKRCRSCQQAASRESSKRHQQQQRSRIDNPDVGLKSKNYKIVCRGTGMRAKKTVTIKARSEKEARQKIFEIGLIPFEIL